MTYHKPEVVSLPCATEAIQLVNKCSDHRDSEGDIATSNAYEADE